MTAKWRRAHCPASCPPVTGWDTFTGGADLPCTLLSERRLHDHRQPSASQCLGHSCNIASAPCPHPQAVRLHVQACQRTGSQMTASSSARAPSLRCVEVPLTWPLSCSDDLPMLCLTDGAGTAGWVPASGGQCAPGQGAVQRQHPCLPETAEGVRLATGQPRVHARCSLTRQARAAGSQMHG